MPELASVVAAPLTDALHSALSPTGLVWFNAVDTDATASDASALILAYTGASQLGKQPLGLSPDARALLHTHVPGLDFDRWTVSDAARCVLLLRRASAVGPDACAEVAVATYEQGDSSEQQSWLKAVALLPSPDRFIPLAVDACRTNILPVFEALACGNPFPARYLPDPNFNQMVLKALFNAVPLTGIYRLAERRNPELARMANDYADERRAAGRTVPADIGLAL